MPNTEQAISDLMTTAEVAAAKSVDVATVNRWARSGRLHPVRKLPGRTGAYLFLRADIEALLGGAA